MLTDRFDRRHTYLRLAITDNCNFRCTYCMPCEKHSFLPSDKLMSRSEILTIAEKFVETGVTKIRLTGGEPLVRKDAKEIINDLSKLPVELLITTNGMLIDQFIQPFLDAGIKKVNVSLDSLSPGKFRTLTQRDAFHRVWNNIELLIRNDLQVKLNVVLMKGINDDEITDFINLTRHLPLSIRFIEFMPFNGNSWKKDLVVTAEEILRTAILNNIDYTLLEGKKNDTAKNYRIDQAVGTFGIISTMSEPFCSGCNRVRITADGKMKNCLFSRSETDLLAALRSGEDIESLIRMNVWNKSKEQGGQLGKSYTTINSSTIKNRSMVRIGG